MTGTPATAVPTGNLYDKYGSTNPVVRRLMGGFTAALDELWEIAAPESVLDVGCGEGVLTAEWAERLGDRRVVGVDLDDPGLRAEWERRPRPNLEFLAADAGVLPFQADEFDVATAIEVVEADLEMRTTALEDKGDEPLKALQGTKLRLGGEGDELKTDEATIKELGGQLYELETDLEEIGDLAYLGDLGNTPGHVNHWSKVGFHSLLTRHGRVLEVRTPLPWTVALVGLD